MTENRVRGPPVTYYLLCLSSPEAFLVLLVLQFLALTDDGICGMTLEAVACWIVASGIDLSAKILCRCELQAFGRGYGAELVAATIGIVIGALWYVDDGKGAEALDGNTQGSLGKLMPDLVENCR